jgi:hypothetical protein
MAHWKNGLFLVGALAALGMGQAQADDGTDQNATTTDSTATTTKSTTTKHMKKHSMTKAAKAKKAAAARTAADTAGSTTGPADDTGHLDSLDKKQGNPGTPGTGSAASGTVDDTGHLDSQGKSAPPVEQEKAADPSNSEGSQGDCRGRRHHPGMIAG